MWLTDNNHTERRKASRLSRRLPARQSGILGVGQVLERGLEQFTPPLADDSIGSSLWSSSSYHGVEEDTLGERTGQALKRALRVSTLACHTQSRD